MFKKSGTPVMPAAVLKRAREEHPELVEQLADPATRPRAHTALCQLYPEMKPRSGTKWIAIAIVGLVLLAVSIVMFSDGSPIPTETGGAPDDPNSTQGEGNGSALLVSGWESRHILKGHEESVWSIAIAPDGAWLASSSLDDTVRIWDAESGRARHVLEGSGDFAIAPDCTWLASASDDHTVRIWDVATGRERHVLRGHEDAVASVDIASDGTWLASASSDKTVRVWNANTGHERRVLHGHKAGVLDVAIAPDSTWLASGSRDGSVQIWDAETGQGRHLLPGHTGQVFEVAIAPDGTWLASASGDHTVRVWDTETGHERHVLRGHHGLVCGIAIAPEGTWLASASTDETVRIWDVATGRTRHVLRLEYPPAGMHDVVIAPDSEWVAAALLDGTVRIWDADTGREMHVLRGHAEEPASHVAISPDGAWLASASYDRTVRIWDAAMGPSTKPSPSATAVANTDPGEDRVDQQSHHAITITSATGEIRHNGIGIMPPFSRNKLTELLGRPTIAEDLGGLVELRWNHLGIQCQVVSSGEIEGITIRVTPIDEPEWDNVQPAFQGLLAVDGSMLTDRTDPSDFSHNGFSRAQGNLWSKKHVWLTVNANTGGLNTVYIHRAPNMFD